MENKKVIVRANRAGVFFGTLESRNGSEVRLSNCRRLWKWSGAASLSQLAVCGVKRPNDCKFTVVVSDIEILGVIEVILCTDVAIASIESTPVWKI